MLIELLSWRLCFPENYILRHLSYFPHYMSNHHSLYGVELNTSYTPQNPHFHPSAPTPNTINSWIERKSYNVEGRSQTLFKAWDLRTGAIVGDYSVSSHVLNRLS